MPGRFERFEAHAAEFHQSPVAERGETVSRLCGRPEVDRRPCTIAQLQMAGDEVGVQVGQEDVPDLESVLTGKPKIPIDVTLGVDDGSDVGALVPNQVRSVRETPEVELLEDHARLP